MEEFVLNPALGFNTIVVDFDIPGCGRSNKMDFRFPAHGKQMNQDAARKPSAYYEDKADIIFVFENYKERIYSLHCAVIVPGQESCINNHCSLAPKQTEYINKFIRSKRFREICIALFEGIKEKIDEAYKEYLKSKK